MTEDPRYDGHPGVADSGPQLSADTTFSLLADGQRRRVLAYLSEMQGETADVGDLAEHVADEVDRRRALTALYHVHLPKLADAGVVEYDRRSETVRYTGDPSVEATLDAVSDADLPLP